MVRLAHSASRRCPGTLPVAPTLLPAQSLPPIRLSIGGTCRSRSGPVFLFERAPVARCSPNPQAAAFNRAPAVEGPCARRGSPATHGKFPLTAGPVPPCLCLPDCLPLHAPSGVACCPPSRAPHTHTHTPCHAHSYRHIQPLPLPPSPPNNAHAALPFPRLTPPSPSTAPTFTLTLSLTPTPHPHPVPNTHPPPSPSP